MYAPVKTVRRVTFNFTPIIMCDYCTKCASYAAQIAFDVNNSIKNNETFSLLDTALKEYHDNERTAR